MNLPTNAILPYAKPDQPSLTLTHSLYPLPSSQARLRGRIALVPDVDLNAYRFRALVDWVEFKMQFGRGVQVQQVQPILNKIFGRNCHIDGQDEGPGKVFTRCKIRVQEPKNLALVAEAHLALVAAFGETASSEITGIEISVDAYPNAPSVTARAHLLGAIQRTIWTERDIWTNSKSRPRMIYAKDGKSDVEKLSPAAGSDRTGKASIDPTKHNSPKMDSTMYLGAQYDEISIRIMEKVMDQQHPDGTRTDLTEDSRRVRIEVTVIGSALHHLALTDVASLKDITFTRLQKRFFQFKLPTFSLREPIRKGVDFAHNHFAAMRAQTYLNAGVVGLMAMDAARDRQRRKIRPRVKTLYGEMGLPKHVLLQERQAPALVSYEALNRKFALAFQQLSKREGNAWKRV